MEVQTFCSERTFGSRRPVPRDRKPQSPRKKPHRGRRLLQRLLSSRHEPRVEAVRFEAHHMPRRGVARARDERDLGPEISEGASERGRAARARYLRYGEEQEGSSFGDGVLREVSCGSD